jgi:hypothetical protein
MIVCSTKNSAAGRRAKVEWMLETAIIHSINLKNRGKGYSKPARLKLNRGRLLNIRVLGLKHFTNRVDKNG